MTNVNGVTGLTEYSSLSGVKYTAEDGYTIEQEKDEEYNSVYTKVSDEEGKLIYEERDTSISDSSSTYYYDENGKLTLKSSEWYECGSGFGRTGAHEGEIDRTTTLYDDQERPTTSIHYQNYGGSLMSHENINYIHEENGDYTTYVDSNKNGKLDAEEHNYRTHHYNANGDYLSCEEFEANHPAETPNKSDLEPIQPVEKSEEKEEKGFFGKMFESIGNFFKNLFGG